MLWEDELSERKMRILKTLIDDYIQTAQPVGSRTISKKHELGLSSATIRNEMADLEEMGYITQPHTSAGRVPSDKGYRLYVDHLMQAHILAMEDIKQIKNAIELRMNEINTLIVRASDIISIITGYTSIAL
ncbi:MAG: HrcA family transcriptional regulator, partial [Ruminiclostridium sp.]|nr:HrcA family transcriptional regulator [Ruminiclostridium sp.]